MSFILDALKKADAERYATTKRDGLQGAVLRDQPSSDNASLSSSIWAFTSKTRSFFLVLFMFSLVVGVVGSVWYKQRRVVPTATIATTTLLDSAPAPALSKMPSEKLTSPASEIKTEVAVPSPVAPAASSKLTLAASTKIPSRPQAPNPVVSSTQSSRSQIPTFAQLPLSLRQEIPVLAISGSIFAQNPKDRMLLVDKRMLREGDEIAPGLILETIKEKSAVLKYKGMLFSVAN